MGDTGALALGGAIGAVAVLLKSEFLLLLVGGVFVLEGLSVMLQIGWFKFSRWRWGEGRRLLRMAPLHHHFEKLGWPEPARRHALLHSRRHLRARRPRDAEDPLMGRNGRLPLFAPGDPVAVLGLGVSGTAAARLVHSLGGDVYASDAFEGPRQREAVEALTAEGIAAEVGRHDVERILNARLVVTSPGIAPSAEIRRTVANAGVPTVAEIEIAYRHLTSRVIGITGTNGKTTTTALCGHLLQQAGVNAITAGQHRTASLRCPHDGAAARLGRGRAQFVSARPISVPSARRSACW